MALRGDVSSYRRYSPIYVLLLVWALAALLVTHGLDARETTRASNGEAAIYRS
jgi:hypothetical protein